MRAIGAIPGVSRLLLRLVDRGYRSSLAKQGYRDIASEPATGRRRLCRARVSAAAQAPQPSRAVSVAEVRRESANALTLVLEDAPVPGRPFGFRPGQCFTLAADCGGAPYRRAYSATSVPSTGQLNLTVKRVEQGRFSAHVQQQVRVGDRLSVRVPWAPSTPAPPRPSGRC
ncbi:ferredoxin--NADP reductase [Streptomyces antibioticus]|uniref:ferredoxin--NADP reductase n=1 Tax=Streptomyces antibioticus TaxID=1890 RepID=UPI00367A1C53